MTRLLPSPIVAVVIVTIGTLAASYAIVKASNRSAFWNMWVGALAVAIAAILLVIAVILLVRRAFPEFYGVGW